MTTWDSLHPFPPSYFSKNKKSRKKKRTPSDVAVQVATGEVAVGTDEVVVVIDEAEVAIDEAVAVRDEAVIIEVAAESDVAVANDVTGRKRHRLMS